MRTTPLPSPKCSKNYQPDPPVSTLNCSETSGHIDIPTPPYDKSKYADVWGVHWSDCNYLCKMTKYNYEENMDWNGKWWSKGNGVMKQKGLPPTRLRKISTILAQDDPNRYERAIKEMDNDKMLRERRRRRRHIRLNRKNEAMSIE